MNTLDDDLRSLFTRQADAMPVPAPILDRPVARVSSLDDRRPRRWLLAAAALALVGAGGLALAQRGGAPAAPADAPPEAPAFLYETPTVRLSADTVEVIVGNEVFVPHEVLVVSDPGDAGYTTLELEWTDAGVDQRIYVYFASDGTQWWADEIRTYGGPGDDRWITTEGQWFTSALGTAWTGDLDLPNLRITGMSLEAFRRPDVCDHPTRPLAVVSMFPTIDGYAGQGFAGAAEVIDTTTCTVLDASSYTLQASVDDPSVAELADVMAVVRPLRYELEFGSVGATTLRLTVLDAAGAEVGTATVPVTVHDDAGVVVDNVLARPDGADTAVAVSG